MAKARAKPPLTLEEHGAIGVDLSSMHERLLAIADDLGERYPAKLRDAATRVAGMVTNLAGALDAVLWSEQRGKVDRATLGAVYFPDGPGSVTDADETTP
jgi:hypothetical protein